MRKLKTRLKKHINKHIQKHEQPGLLAFAGRTVSAQLHLVGAALAVLGLIFLLYFSWNKFKANHILACLIFGLTGISVFVSSTLYHFCSDGYVISKQLDKWLNDFDHFSIYLFIAGTYTPFVVNVVSKPWDLILLILIWTIAFTGILYSHFKPRLPAWAQHRIISTGIFLMMGWTLVIRWHEIYVNLSSNSFNLLLAGGLSYSIGAVIYILEWPNFVKGVFGFHELWHIMVMLGFGFHYFLILGFYLA